MYVLHHKSEDKPPTDIKNDAKVRKRKKEKNLRLRLSLVVPAHPLGKGGWRLGSEEDKAS
jgi:hypothetical protein